jgi:hypothetical protein
MERIFKETTADYFRALSRHLLGGIEKNYQTEIWIREVPSAKEEC